MSAAAVPGGVLLLWLSIAGRPCAVADGVRFCPAGLGYIARECPPAPPRRRLPILQWPLQAHTAETRVPERLTGSSCATIECAGAAALTHMRDVCLRGSTVYLVSGVAGAPLPLTNASFGPRRSRHATLQLREVRSFAEIPGPLVWLQHAWVLGANPVRYGVNNLFHSVTEDIEWLAKLARCGRLRVGGSSRLLLLHGKALLNNSTLGLLWDLASGGARAYHLQQGGEDTFCFRLAHAETHGSPEQLRDVRAACARARAWDETAWEGWPADKRDVFKGFPSIVHAAFARLRLPEPPERAADGKWARPRVTIVHRLRNRRLLNVRYLAVLLRDAGYDVTVGGFECLPMHEQIAIAANSSTLIGVHGAGLLTRSFSSCAQRRALRRRTARITTACAAGAASCPPRATRSCPTARAPRRGA